MMPDESFEELRRVLDTRVRTETRTPDCLQDDLIAALADGTLAVEIRASVLPHVASCPRCRAQVASVARALADPDIARELPETRERDRRRYRLTLPLAAAAVVLLLLWLPTDDGLPHRGPPLQPPPASVPVLRAPVGAVAVVNDLRWSLVAGADRYRVTVFDAGGRVVYAAELSDSIVLFPDSVALVPGVSYFWKVDARTGFDRWTGSELVEFEVAGQGRP